MNTHESCINVVCTSRNVVLDSIHKMFKSSLHMLFHLVSKPSYMVTSSLYKFLMGERNHFMQEIGKKKKKTICP
jgi:hypothetical protein